MKRRTIRIGSVILLVLAGLFLPGEAFAQGGTWTTVAPMPTPRQFLAAAEVNGLIYAVLRAFPSGPSRGVSPCSSERIVPEL